MNDKATAPDDPDIDDVFVEPTDESRDWALKPLVPAVPHGWPATRFRVFCLWVVAAIAFAAGAAWALS